MEKKCILRFKRWQESVIKIKLTGRSLPVAISQANMAWTMSLICCWKMLFPVSHSRDQWDSHLYDSFDGCINIFIPSSCAKWLIVTYDVELVLWFKFTDNFGTCEILALCISYFWSLQIMESWWLDFHN